MFYKFWFNRDIALLTENRCRFDVRKHQEDPSFLMCTLWPIMSNRIDVWLMSNPPMSTFDELEHPTDNCYIIWESDANWASWYRFVVYPPRMSMSGLFTSIHHRHTMKIRGEFRCRHPRQLDLDTTSALPIVNRWKLGILIYRIRCLSSSNVDVGFIYIDTA